MAAIPLHDRDGNLVAVAIVDVDDYDRLARYRWSLSRSGHVRRVARSGGRRHVVYLHREVIRATRGDGLQVEHINGEKLDNRKRNLRVRAAVSGATLTRAPAPVDEPWSPDIPESVR